MGGTGGEEGRGGEGFWPVESASEAGSAQAPPAPCPPPHTHTEGRTVSTTLRWTAPPPPLLVVRCAPSGSPQHLPR